MVVLTAKMTTSIMGKNFWKCPLKKRPVQYDKEEVLLPVPKIEKKEIEDITEPENLSTKPEDLSKTGRYPKTMSPPAKSEQYPKVLTPPEDEYPRDSPSEYSYYSSAVIPSAFQPLHLNNQSDFFQSRWTPPALVPRPYHNFIQRPYAYHYDGYSYVPPLLQLSPTRSMETLSSYARESSCSPPSVDYITKVHGHNIVHPTRYRPYSAASLSPTSSDNSFQSNSPPLEEPTAEDLSSPLSESSEPTIIPEKKRKDNLNLQRYNCKPCGKSYSTFSGLTKHQQYHCPAVDGNQVKKSFSCKYCQKVYTSLGALKMHIRTHTLPCKCHMCGKAFSRPWLLQGHIRTHTGEKPFSCQHCNRAFADRSNLRAHLQTHSDIKKYSCTTCSKTFSRMSLLTKHNDGGCPGNGPQIQSYPSSSEIIVY